MGGQTSSTSCLECEIGKYNEREASNACKTCSPGTYNGVKGQKECTLCPVETYNDQPGRVSEMDCKKCENGKFNNKEGQSSCTEGVGLFVLFWILKGIGIVTALAFAYKIYTFIKLYKDGHLNKRMLSRKCGLLRTFIAFVAFGKVGEAVEKNEDRNWEPNPLGNMGMASGKVEEVAGKNEDRNWEPNPLENMGMASEKVGEAVEKEEDRKWEPNPLENSGTVSIEMSSVPRQSVCEILDDANLGKYKSKFVSIGLESSADLAVADDEDLEEAGLSNFQKKKLRRALKKKGGRE